MKRTLLVFITALAVIVVTGCASDKGATKADKNKAVAKMQILPSDSKIKIGETVQLIANGFDKNGKGVAVNPKWSVDAAGQKAVDMKSVDKSQAVFAGKQLGTAVITAEVGGIKATSKIEVVKVKPAAAKK